MAKKYITEEIQIGAHSLDEAMMADNILKLNLIDFSGTVEESTGYPRIIWNNFPLISLAAQSATGQVGVRIEEPFSTAQQAEFDGVVNAYNGVSAGTYADYSTTSNMLSVWGSASITKDLTVSQFLYVANDLRAYGDVIAYYQSDKRLKDNIKPIENTLDKVSKLGGYEYDWNDKQDTYEGHDIGVIAQEVEEVFPELVTTRENGYKAVKYEKLVAVLISAVNELRKEVEQLKSK